MDKRAAVVTNFDYTWACLLMSMNIRVLSVPGFGLYSALMRAVITVVGKDKPGIIAGVSSALAEQEVNILDISQTIMQGYFTMIMLVDLAGMKIALQPLRDRLSELAASVGVTISVQHEDVFTSMHRV